MQHSENYILGFEKPLHVLQCMLIELRINIYTLYGKSSAQTLFCES